jgi:Protein tyrosine and serine/threonine kinase
LFWHLIIFQQYCDEALIWRQLQHENVLPFLGCCTDAFSPRYALVSPWMENGNMLSYTTRHPDTNRLFLVSALL